jgi:hypothetical protein
MDYIPIGQYEKHENNPFLPEAVENLQVKRRSQMVHPTQREAVQQVQVVDTKTGEVTDVHTAFLKVVQVDEERFVKLFLAELGALWDLPKPALRILTYVIQCLRMNEDRIIFNPKECMKYTGYKTEKSVFTGIAELIKHGIIARSTLPNIYFINPMIVFNGNRITFAKTYVKKRKKTEDPNQLKLFDEQEQLPAPEEGTSDEQSSG